MRRGGRGYRHLDERLERGEAGPGGPAAEGGGLGRVLRLAREERRLLAWSTLALLVAAAASLAIPLQLGAVMDALSRGDETEAESRARLRAAVLRLCGVVAVSAVASFFRASGFTVAGERVVARLRKRLFRSVLSQEVAFFDETRTGELTSRLAADTQTVRSAATVNLSMALRTAVSIAGALVVLFYLSWRLTLVMLAVVPVVALAARRYGTFVRGLSKSAQDALARATETAEESLAHVRTVRSFAQESRHLDAYSERIEETFAIGRRLGLAYGVFTSFMSVFAGGAVIGVLYYGGVLVLRGELTPGRLTSFLLYTIQVGAGVAGLAGLFADFSRAVGASDRVFALLERRPAIDCAVPAEASGATAVPLGDAAAAAARPAFQLPTAAQRAAGGRRLEGRVELRGVRFAYPSRPDAEVLRDFSLELRPGTTTALVGRSGGGKSTVCRLLLRHYDPAAGAVLFDGRDVREYDPRWLRGPRGVAVVQQEPVLFCDAVWRNIAYGAPGIGGAERFADLPAGARERVVEAARVASAHGFIEALGDGYDTVVGERGVTLSGGQRQRVAVARAVLLDPAVLLLDEASSALDAESERLVQDALARLRRGRTTLVVAHRLSTVKDADRVVVVEAGRVAEAGTHAELLAGGAEGVYATLVRHQLA